MANVYETEKRLYREVTQKVEGALPGVEVLAVQLTGPDRFVVYIDDARGVDHALCERVTNVLRSYLTVFAIDVSSPGVERPLRRRAHFSRAAGRTVAVRTADEIEGRKRFRGQLVSADSETVTLATEADGRVHIPYEQIVRANLIDEG